MAGNRNIAEDPYERLANAIVLQAVSDYRVALKNGMQEDWKWGSFIRLLQDTD